MGPKTMVPEQNGRNKLAHVFVKVTEVLCVVCCVFCVFCVLCVCVFCVCVCCVCGVLCVCFPRIGVLNMFAQDL